MAGLPSIDDSSASTSRSFIKAKTRSDGEGRCPKGAATDVCQDVKRRIDRYLLFNYYRTEGYISRLDAALFRELIIGQVKDGIEGSLAEIGVHYGRSFFLLACGRSVSERCLAIDLFEDDALHTNRGGVGRFGGFRKNCHNYGYNLREEEVLKRSSREISADEILSRVGRVRFFSIDGGHMYEDVMNDLRLAEKVLTKDGIICLDDILSALWPEVAIATFDWLRGQNQRFVPFLATKEKLYVCDSSCAPLYLSMIRENKQLNSLVFRNISLLSHEVTVLLPSVASRVAERAIDSLFSLCRGVTDRFAGPKNQSTGAPRNELLVVRK
jgi:Methyltransferase domain